ncbi:hypothetical protein ACFVW8_27100 [Streptomyces sp. NPDC058221]|uniref:hypothetical protein n=1 Tax=Streptomyces sp. NPDC058221 TaxID=3346388 RepID=UPI0036EC5151
MAHPLLDIDALTEVEPCLRQMGELFTAFRDQDSARFRVPPLPQVARAFGQVLDAHLAVEAAGYVAVDFYDGAILYDFVRVPRLLLDAGDREDAWRGPPAQLGVLARAACPDPGQRFPSVREFAAAWWTASRSCAR